METKKLYNMNYLKGLHPKGSNELRMRTTKNGLRGLMLRGVALLMMLVGASLPAQADDYVIMANSGGTWHFYAFNSTSNTANYYYAIDATSFSYSICVWSGSSNSSFRNSNNTSYGLYYNSNSYLQNRTNYDNFTIVNNKIHSNDRYICYYNNTWYTGRTNNDIYRNGISDVLYSIASTTGSWTTPASITGSQVTFSELESFNYSADAAYRPTYYTLTGASTYYVQEGGTPSNTAPAASSTGITYAWTIGSNASYDDGHVRLTSSGSGVTVEYYSYYDTDTQLTLSLTATHTASGSTSNTATKTITFEAPKIDPTSLTISSGNTMTVYAGQTGNITYSLLPDPCYDNVTFASDATSIATVNASGVVTGVSTGTATITVTAYTIGGTTNASLTKTVTVTVKNKVATPVITFTPDPSDNTQATATITCSTPGTTIYYKVNSGAFAEYTTGVELNEYDAITAYAVMSPNPGDLWDNSDEAIDTYVSCSTGTPTISYLQSGTTANVTITGEAGATIYYTTDGSDPSTSNYTGTGTSPVTFNGVANGTTVKAVAKNGTCSQSAIVSMDMVLSGVSGGVVTLNDREDHSWSYYSDGSTPSQLHSLNPADVKITYYGDGIMMTGSANYTASSTDYITSTHGDYKVGAKVNVGGENENTFVYYKTLERTDGSTSANPTGRCPYKPIPNPFQVRPRYKDRGTTDANDFTGWRGFQCWRLKSVTGGAVYSDATGGTALSTGAVINAETEIYFAPTAEYGMEVELEAVWAIAYVTKANGNGENAVGTNNVGYERNFCVPTTGAGYTLYTGTGKRITNANHIPVTISCYYPDGTAPDNTANSISNTATSLTADTKFENIPINLTSNTLTLANYDIIVGRGCGTSTINTLQAINGNVTDLDYTIRLESGTVNNFSFVRTSSCTVSGRYMVRGIMGSDYDRAKGDNDKLSISPNSTLFFSTSVTFSGASNKDQKTFDCVFKSGKYQSQQWNGTIQSGQQGYQHVAYLGQNSAGNTYAGVRYVTVEGGEFSGMCGGRGVGSESTTYMTPDVITFDLRITGGTFHGAVYGGAADNPSIGSRRFIITGGEIQSWIAGGCNGTGSTSGTGATNGNSYIYVGGTTLVGGDNPMTINETNGGQVFGAGRGISGRASSVNHSHVAIADEAVVCNNNNTANIPVGGNVYGGSYNGTIATESNVYILGGRVEGSAFGGSYGNGTAIPAANITMTGGLVTNGVYGGSNNTGTVNNVTMQIDGGQVGTSSANANVHGGGFGQATRVSQNVELTLGSGCDATDGVTVYGDVYGGSALGYVNGTSATNTYHTYVSLYKGTIYGGLYGGGLGNSTVAANVYGPVQVKVYGGSVRPNDGTGENGSGGVFGCNNVNGTPAGTVTVDLYGTDPAEAGQEFALYAVYGGGNRSDYTGTPVVTIHGCDNHIEYVYGGGNASDVAGTNVTIWGGHIGNAFGGGNGFSTTNNHTNASADHYNPGANITTGGTNLTIHGGQIDAAFGGSNQYGRIDGGINVTVVEGVESGTDPCSGAAYAACTTNTIGELYGGGNEAPAQTSGGDFITPSVTISSCDMEITNLFGGAKKADHGADINLVITKGKFQNVFGGNNLGGTITGNVTLTLKGGTMINAFGGNNQGGSITGTITVTVDSTGNDCPLKVENVYGGGNEAAYEPTDNTITSPVVNVVNGTVRNAVFGGGLGSAAGVTANPQVTIGGTGSKHAIVGGRLIADSDDGEGNVYGGGSQADVLSTSANNGNTHVILTGNARVKGNVYGGGNQADVEGNTKVEMR